MKPSSTVKSKNTKHSRVLSQPPQTASRPAEGPTDSAASQRSTEVLVPTDPPAPVTFVEAKIDVGLGNALFIRGEGDGLSWDKGHPLMCVEPARWVWFAQSPTQRAVFKLLLNDEIWSAGDNVVVEPGSKVEVVPRF